MTRTIACSRPELRTTKHFQPRACLRGHAYETLLLITSLKRRGKLSKLELFREKEGRDTMAGNPRKTITRNAGILDPIVGYLGYDLKYSTDNWVEYSLYPFVSGTKRTTFQNTRASGILSNTLVLDFELLLHRRTQTSVGFVYS